MILKITFIVFINYLNFYTVDSGGSGGGGGKPSDSKDGSTPKPLTKEEIISGFASNKFDLATFNFINNEVVLFFNSFFIYRDSTKCFSTKDDGSLKLSLSPNNLHDYRETSADFVNAACGGSKCVLAKYRIYIFSAVLKTTKHSIFISVYNSDEKCLQLFVLYSGDGITDPKCFKINPPAVFISRYVYPKTNSFSILGEDDKKLIFKQDSTFANDLPENMKVNMYDESYGVTLYPETENFMAVYSLKRRTIKAYKIDYYAKEINNTYYAVATPLKSMDDLTMNDAFLIDEASQGEYDARKPDYELYTGRKPPKKKPPKKETSNFLKKIIIFAIIIVVIGASIIVLLLIKKGKKGGSSAGSSAGSRAGSNAGSRAGSNAGSRLVSSPAGISRGNTSSLGSKVGSTAAKGSKAFGSKAGGSVGKGSFVKGSVVKGSVVKGSVGKGSVKATPKLKV